MEKKNKIILIVSIIVIIGSITLSVLTLTKKEEEPFTIEGINLPENKEILKDAKVDELDIIDVSLITREDISSYKATVANNTDKDITINNLYVVFHQDEEEIKILALKNATIKSKTSTFISIASEIDLSKATKIEYVIE